LSVPRLPREFQSDGPMRIAEIIPHPNWILSVVSADGLIGEFDVTPYLQDEAFKDLQSVSELKDPAASCEESFHTYGIKHTCSRSLTPKHHDYDCIQHYRSRRDSEPSRNALAVVFMKVSNGGYFVEWDCGADLSADTIEAHWKITGNVSTMSIKQGKTELH
jgi:hypothetical protein